MNEVHANIERLEEKAISLKNGKKIPGGTQALRRSYCTQERELWRQR